MDFVSAWTATVELATTVFNYVTGGKTRDERTVHQKVQDLENAWDRAMERGDIRAAADIRTQLRKLRDELLAGRRP